MPEFDILNFKPVIIKNFFDESDIDDIQNTINNKIKDNINNNLPEYNDFEINIGSGAFMYGQGNINQQFSQNIVYKVTNKIETILNLKIEELGLSFLRYSWLTGHEPRLIPHVDTYKDGNNNKFHKMSFSVPLRNNFNWDISVNNATYKMNNNDALLFTVTADIHRRLFRYFTKEDQYDVFIARFLIKDYKVNASISKYKDIEERLEKFIQMQEYEKRSVPNGI